MNAVCLESYLETPKHKHPLLHIVTFLPLILTMLILGTHFVNVDIHVSLQKTSAYKQLQV